MSHHLSTEKMHDLLDGLLPSEDARQARTHLGACATCREAHERLTATLAALAQLPSEAEAPRGTWSAIESRLTARATEDAEVLPLPRRRRGGGRRFAFTLPQLAAAAAVVAFLSAGSVWMAMSPGRPQEQAALPGATVGPAQGSAARLAASGGAAYDQALLELEDIVEQGRDVLAPETVAALDRSLTTIDQAIADIRDALEKDPSSQVLARMLINQQRTKLRVLRQAASAMQSTS